LVTEQRRRRFSTPSPQPTTSTAQLIETLRRLRSARLVNLGTESLNAPAPAPIPAPAPPALPEQGGGNPILGVLQSIFNFGPSLPEAVRSPITGALGTASDAISFIDQPFAAASSAIGVPSPFSSALGPLSAIPGVPDVPIPGVSETEASPLARKELVKFLTGGQGLGETRQNLQNIQQAKPTGERIASELAGPFGLAEAAIPLGPLAKVAKLTKLIPARTVALPAQTRNIGTTQALTTALRGGPRLPKTVTTPAQTLSVSTSGIPPVVVARQFPNIHELAEDPEILRQLHAGGVWRATEGLPTPLKKALRAPFHIINRNAIIDPDDVVAKFEAIHDWMAAVVPDAGSTTALRVRALGDPADLFRLDTKNVSLLPEFGGRTFNEIAENLTALRPRLTPQQNAWFDNFGKLVDEMNDYLISQGIPRDALFKGTQLDYFPRIYKMFKDIELRQGLGRLGSVPFYEKFRAYEFIEDAIQAGFVVSNPMEAIELLFTSMYKQVADKRLVDILRPYGFTINQRIDQKILQTTVDAQRRLDGVRQASTFVRTFSTKGIERAPRPTAQLAGRTLAEDHAPDLMRRLDEINAMTRIADRRTAFKNLRSDTAKQLDAARKYSQAARKEAAQAREVAKARGFMGETQFPGTGVGGRIFTPESLADHINPEGLINDFKTIPDAQLKELRQILAGPTKDWLDSAQSIASVSRTLQAGTDLGVGTIHLLPIMLTRPTVWAKAMETSLLAMRDPAVMAKLIDDHWETVQKLIRFNQFHGGGSEYVEALQKGGILYRGARKIPGVAGERVAGLLQSFEAQFNGALIASKILLWEAMEPMFLRAGPEALNDLASHIAKMTGTMSMANMGIRPGTRKVLGGLLMFAPRYRMAVYGLMTDMFRGGVRGGLAREQMGKMMAGGLILYAAMAHRLDQPMNLDPSKGNFLTFKVGESNIGFGSAFVSVARFTASFLKQAIQDPMAAVRIDRRDNRLQRFLRGQLSPTSGMGVDVATGRNFIGDPTTSSFPGFFSNVVLENILPFYVSGMADYPRPGWSSVPAEFGGLRSFPVSLYERARDQADVLAMKEQGVRYRDMGRTDQIEFENAHPAIQAQFQEANVVWEARGFGLSQQFSAYRNRINSFMETTYEPRIEQLMAMFEKRLGDPGQGDRLRDGLRDIGFLLGKEYERLNREFPDVALALEEQGSDPNANIEDLAYFEYIRNVVVADFEIVDPLTGIPTGEFDFQRREQVEGEFLQKYGQTVYDEVQRRRLASTQTPILLLELQQGRDFLKKYWEVGETILDSAGRSDLQGQLRAFKKANSEQQAEMAALEPMLRQVRTAATRARQQFRAAHADVDAFLLRWDYPGRLQHSDNLARDIEDIQRTPVFLGNGQASGT
jgi:hypothetical protein